MRGNGKGSNVKESNQQKRLKIVYLAVIQETLNKGAYRYFPT
jgi:hypothetical protein